jgi:hypothetical protein
MILQKEGNRLDLEILLKTIFQITKDYSMIPQMYLKGTQNQQKIIRK